MSRVGRAGAGRTEGRGKGRRLAQGRHWGKRDRATALEAERFILCIFFNLRKRLLGTCKFLLLEFTLSSLYLGGWQGGDQKHG